MHLVDGIMHRINDLIYKATMPESDEGTFISNAEREEIEREVKILIKKAMDLLEDAGSLERTSPCSFCLHSKPLKEMQ
jgi:hypothetical protein